MTPRQIELARHALGLPNKAKRSYRNHFIAGPGHSDYLDWARMVFDGHAKESRRSQLTPGGDPCFFLTYRGAMAALEKGEALDLEGFPPRVGQIWREVDPRKERYVRITNVDTKRHGAHARIGIESVHHVDGTWFHVPGTSYTLTADPGRFNWRRGGYRLHDGHEGTPTLWRQP